MDKDTRYMSTRQIALELLRRQEQERLNAALKSWQPYFAERNQQPNDNKLVLNLRGN